MPEADFVLLLPYDEVALAHLVVSHPPNDFWRERLPEPPVRGDVEQGLVRDRRLTVYEAGREGRRRAGAARPRGRGGASSSKPEAPEHF